MRHLVTLALVVVCSLLAATTSAQRRCPHGTKPDGTCKPPPPPPPPAVVEFDVEPPDAEVFVVDDEGQKVALGPASEPLPLAKIRHALGGSRESRFTFVFTHQGHEDAQLSVQVRPAGPTKSEHVALFRWPELVLQGHDLNTTVHVDDVEVTVGAAPRLRLGEHTIKAQRPNYDDYSEHIVVRRDGPSPIVHQLALHAKPCHVRVSRGDFQSVAVLINGESVGMVASAEDQLFPCDGGKSRHVVELVVAPDIRFPHTIATEPAGEVSIEPPQLTQRVPAAPVRPTTDEIDRYKAACSAGRDRLAGVHEDPRACLAVGHSELQHYDAHPDRARLLVARTYLESACNGGELGGCLSLAFVLRNIEPTSRAWQVVADRVCRSDQAYDDVKARGCEFPFARAEVNPTVYESRPTQLREDDWGLDLAFMVMSGMNFLHDAKPIYQEFGLELVVRGPGAWKYFMPTLSYDVLRMRSMEGFDDVEQRRSRVYRAGIGLSAGFLLALGTYHVQLRVAGRGTLSFNDERNALGVDGGLRFAPTPTHTIDVGMLYETMPVRTANVEVLDQSFRLSDWTLVPLPYVRYRVSFVDLN